MLLRASEIMLIGGTMLAVIVVAAIVAVVIRQGRQSSNDAGDRAQSQRPPLDRESMQQI
jgi:hypothetical protein